MQTSSLDSNGHGPIYEKETQPSLKSPWGFSSLDMSQQQNMTSNIDIHNQAWSSYLREG